MKPTQANLREWLEHAKYTVVGQHADYVERFEKLKDQSSNEGQQLLASIIRREGAIDLLELIVDEFPSLATVINKVDNTEVVSSTAKAVERAMKESSGLPKKVANKPVKKKKAPVTETH